MSARETNWAGNIVYRAARVARPRSVSEARELVSENGQVRAVGTGTRSTASPTPRAC